MPAATELVKLLAANYAVACPFGANLRPMFPEAKVTPAVEMPIKMWMATSNGNVRTYFSGIVVNVHARMHQMKSGPLTPSTDLLL